MPRNPRGRWARWYESVIEDKVTYTDREFRAFAHLIALGSSREGEFKDRAALDHLMGPLADQIDVLIDRKDLRRTGGKRLVIVGWPTYQGTKKDATAAERQARFRERHRDGQGVEEPSSSPRGALVELPERSPLTHESNGVTGVTRARPRISSPLGGTSLVENGTHAPELDTYVAVSRIVEDLTGQAYALRSPTSPVALEAVRIAESFGMPAAASAFRQAAEAVEHPNAGQVVYGASNLLHPIPRGGSFKVPTAEEKASADVRADIQRRLAEAGRPQDRRHS